MIALEMLANAAMTVSILLAARNSLHTWWSGILGCLLFAGVFLQANLYADVTLQAFFLVTSFVGWRQWRATGGTAELRVSRSHKHTLMWCVGAGILASTVYGWLLHRFTDAYAPFIDSLVLAFSVVAQLLLMRRQLETWWFWLLVNLLAVPLFFSRELYITAALYAVYFVNALFALRHWQRLLQGQPAQAIAA